jgi:hypothetical protein
MDFETTEVDFEGWLSEGRWCHLLEALGFEVVDAAIPANALAAWGWHGRAVEGLRLAGRAAGCRVVVGEDVPVGMRRKVATAVHRRNPTDTTLWLWTGDRELTLAVVDRTPTGQVFVRSMTVDRHDPDPVGLGQLRALDLQNIAEPDEPDVALAVRRHISAILDQDGLTRAFFDGFRGALDELVAQIENGPVDDETRHDVCLVTLLRIVFLYFLQREGLLDGDRRFLVRHLRRCIAEDLDYWTTVLHPLFFGALNTPAPDRTPAAARLGEIPFLNGGLFEPTPAEVSCPDRAWSNDVWERVLEDFFERFHFTATEPGGPDEARVVDPEMLGKVFEGLMYGDRRSRSGAFYTPRDVVRSMVEHSIEAYVSDEAGLDPRGSLDADARDRVIEALGSIRILDPAVGTGAFLVEALVVLREWRGRLGQTTDYTATRRLVHDHLFGVDVEHTAVRLCELRLWLAMLASMRRESGEMPPLPNLSHRITTGNSLIEPGDVARFDGEGSLRFDDQFRQRREALATRLAELQASYLEAHGARKRRIRRALQHTERTLQELQLVARRAQLVARLSPIERVEESCGLFGEAIVERRQKESARQLRRKLRALDEALDDLRADRTSSAGFAYASRFGKAVNDGFDVIVTNPPWVRASRVDRATKSVLKSRYRAAKNGLWSGARNAGIRTPFGTQPDLSALFVERSLELLKPGGRFCALVPAKLFRSLHGSRLRALLADHTVESVEDFSDADRRLFDATTYPAILTVRRSEPPPDADVEVTIWRGSRQEHFRRSPRRLGISGRYDGEPWLLVPDAVRDVFDRMSARSRPLGVLDDFAPRRGIFTGANDIFVAPAGDFLERLGPSVEDLVRPVISGSSLGEGDTLEILWPYDASGRLLDDLPRAAVEWFEEHADRLRARADYDDRGPLWQAFRVRGDTIGPKVVWRDLAPMLQPHAVEPTAVPLNTVYYVPSADEESARGLDAWMRSTPVRAFALALAERARGGWRRHFAWVVRLLPVPEAVADRAFRGAGDIATAFGLECGEVELLREWISEAAAEVA